MPLVIMEEFGDRIVIRYRKVRRAKQLYESQRWKVPALHPSARTPGLCFRCSQLDLDKIFSHHKSERLISRGGGLRESEFKQPLQCALCKLLAEINSWEPASSYELRSFPRLGTYACPRDTPRDQCPVMIGSLSSSDAERDHLYAGPQVRPWRCSAYLSQAIAHPNAEGPALGSPILNPIQTDFSVPKRWISHCQTNHPKCRVPSTYRTVSFQVIDCTTATIIPSTTAISYLALSYVWGPPSKLSAPIPGPLPNSLPTNLPATVSDAISVTKQLGYRYLWVDRYCIDQTAEKEKAIQIGQMDAIYHSATATLISAVGSDPSTGLPGSGNPNSSRIPHPSDQVGKHMLVSTYKDPKDLIQNSTWMTRAWTMQEAYLSRRVLVFTEEQVYFECPEMQCCEAAHYTLNPYRPKYIFFPNDNRGSIFNKISLYSTRRLTYDSDALNGFLGILKSAQVQDPPVYHIWGIPILTLPYNSENGSEKELFATTSEAFGLGLFWNLKVPGTRRKDFPSWSWTGYKGEIVHYASTDPYPDAGLKAYSEAGWKLVVSVELKDGAVIPLQEFKDSGGLEKEVPGSPHVHITSWTIPLEIVTCPEFIPDWPLQVPWKMDDKKPTHFIRFKLSSPETKHKYTYHPLFLLDADISSSSDLSDCFGILCKRKPDGNFTIDWSGMEYTILVVRKVGDHYERIGSFVARLVKIFEFEDKEDVEFGRNAKEEVVTCWTKDLVTTVLPEYRTIRLG